MEYNQILSFISEQRNDIAGILFFIIFEILVHVIAICYKIADKCDRPILVIHIIVVTIHPPGI